MGRYTGPKHKLCRREGVPLCGRDNCPVKTRLSAPGKRGVRRKRLSEYGQQLREKQKAKRIYGVRERQFRRYFKTALGGKGETGELLFQILERRLDNTLYRAGFAKSRPQARQMVGHGLVRVNGDRVTIPSYLVEVGDKIGLVKKDAPLYEEVVKPSWLKVGKAKREAEVKSFPGGDELGADIDVKLIVEFYSR
jgi:small subunit ribosomal protein S4